MKARAALAIVLLLAACASTPSGSSPATAGAPLSASEAATPEPTGTPTSAASVSPEPSPEPLAWQELDAAGPPAREDHTWTVVGDGRTALLFGGRDGPTVHGDLWSYDLAADRWSELAVAGAPPARFGHEAVWLEGTGLVIFAGQAGTTFFNDLWVYDPEAEAWSQLPAAGDVPVARYGTCAALGTDGRLWISHGFTADQARFSDTRAYDFEAGSWTDETPGGERPLERCLHGCWWTDDGELALYAGQTTGVPALGDRWTLSDDAWSEVEGILPPERNLYARVRVDGGTLVFGGQALDGGFHADLWLLPDGAADATELSPAGDAPAGRAGAELIRDEDGGRLLLFGGRTADGAVGDAWELRGPVDGG